MVLDEPGLSPPRRRKVSKKERRGQLITATMECIARHGFADTTLSHVARVAGLSQGLINLHFKSKEILLVETLKFLSDEYCHVWRSALAAAAQDNAAAQLAALVGAEFNASVCDRKKLAVWFAFQGEAKARPTYAKICTARDIEQRRVVEDLCQEIIDQGAYQNLEAPTIAAGLMALFEGLSLALLMTPRLLDRKAGRKICFVLLAQFFPRHFSVADVEAYK